MSLNILITGITGFVGGHLEQLLIENNLEVTGLARSQKHSLIAKTKLKLIDDLKTCNFEDITQGFDVVVHLAALVHQANQEDIRAYMRLNYDVTLSLAKACITNGVKKFITLSTSHVYEGLQSDFTEKHKLAPISPYAKSKYQATKEISPILSNSSTAWYVIRPPLIYGDGVKGNLKSLAGLISKSSLTPFGAATSPRSYISVHNVCDFILYLIQNNVNPGIYNVSDNCDLSAQELCGLIAQAQNKKINSLPIPKFIMKLMFSAAGKKDHYNKIYGEFRLNIEKALATGWKPKQIEYQDFVL